MQSAGRTSEGPDGTDTFKSELHITTEVGTRDKAIIVLEEKLDLLSTRVGCTRLTHLRVVTGESIVVTTGSGTLLSGEIALPQSTITASTTIRG